MTVTVKCDQMAEGWNYDTCFECRHFSTGKSTKGRYWRCKLNSGSAAEKRVFYGIWAIDYLIMRGKVKETLRETVIVDYIGKRKRRRKIDAT